MKTLITLKVAFICGKCGELTHFDVPIDGQVKKSYCCGAKYRLTSKGLDVQVKRVKKKKGK